MAYEDDIRQGFNRQRRNLMIVSLVLLFAQTTGLTIKKISFFGNEVDLPGPISATHWLWVFWGYWFWRYYAFFRDLGNKGIKQRAKVRILHLVERYYKKKVHRTKKGQKYKDLKNPTFHISKIFQPKRFEYKIHVNVSEGTTHYEGFEDSVSFDNPNERRSLSIIFIRSWIYVLFNTHVFLEYIFPFLLGISPLIYLTLKWLMPI